MRMVAFNRRELLAALLLGGLLLAGLALRFVLLPRPAGEVILEPAARKAEEKQKEIIVHVAGAVNAPGVYRLPEGARVFEALEMAGGMLPGADQAAVNLAAPLYDGQKVTIFYAGEGGPGERPAGDGRVNINTASASELEKLPGIGPVKAAAIVDYRNKNGPFRRIEDLAGVPGIGPKTVEGLREQITLY